MKKRISFITAALITAALSCSVCAEADLKLDAEAAPAEVMVGDKVVVGITAENTGDTDLSGFKIYFEDQPVFEQDVLAPGETAEKQIGLMAWDEDIDAGGIINITAEADELSEPVKTVCTVKVIPNDGSIPRPEEAAGNPNTGNRAGIIPLVAAVLALEVLVGRKRFGSCAK